jgi:hypothetical protein
MAKLSPLFNEAQFIDGVPAVGAKVFTYAAGSSTKLATYTTEDGDVAQANPIILNARGEPDSPIWLTEGQTYKFVFTSSTDTDPPTSPIRTIDDVTGVGDNSVTIDQWVVSGVTPTYVSGTQFTLAGDQTSTFQVNRRIKATVTAGTVYGYISASVFGALTNVTVVLDSGALDSGLSAVQLGLLTPDDPSSPILKDSNFRVSGSADKTKRVALEVDGLTTATTRTLTVQDADGSISLTSEFNYATPDSTSGRLQYPLGYISGLIQANNVADATNDIDISAGVCRDASNTHNIILSAITKRSDAVWAVGTNQGGLDTGVVGNNDYYIWAIKRSDTGVCDVLFSLSSTAPTMPANYDFKRLIGWFKRGGGTIAAFKAYEADGGGLDYLWNSPTLDINLLNTLTTARRTDAVKVPLNFSVVAHLNVLLDDGSLNGAYIYCPDQADLAPSDTVAPLNSIRTSVINQPACQTMSIRTSATGTIAARSLVASVNSYLVVTMGFTWARQS